jgi:two-component system, OmpR family, phosphate regulon sensor histidine kinase PhoR
VVKIDPVEKESNMMKDLRFLKVFVSYVILILLAIAVMDFFLTPRISNIITKSIEDEMIGIAKTIALMPGKDIESKVPEIAKQLGMRVTLVGPTGGVIADSETDARKMENHLHRPEIEQAGIEGQGKATRFSVTLQEGMLYVALAMKENDEVKGYIRLAHSLGKVRESLDHLYQALYLTMYIIAIPSLILAFVFSRKIGSRLNR